MFKHLVTFILEIFSADKLKLYAKYILNNFQVKKQKKHFQETKYLNKNKSKLFSGTLIQKIIENT